ncbi:MAG: hypothetical protein WKF91_22220 [Segetibacter sp.]
MDIFKKKKSEYIEIVPPPEVVIKKGFGYGFKLKYDETNETYSVYLNLPLYDHNGGEIGIFGRATFTFDKFFVIGDRTEPLEKRNFLTPDEWEIFDFKKTKIELLEHAIKSLKEL